VIKRSKRNFTQRIKARDCIKHSIYGTIQFCIVLANICILIKLLLAYSGFFFQRCLKGKLKLRYINNNFILHRKRFTTLIITDLVVKLKYFIASKQNYKAFLNLYIHTYHSHFIYECVAQASRMFQPDVHVLPKLLSYEEYCRREK
jgi:hypothetical protein